MPEFSFLEEKGNKLNTALFPSPSPPLIASGLGSWHSMTLGRAKSPESLVRLRSYLFTDFVSFLSKAGIWAHRELTLLPF